MHHGQDPSKGHYTVDARSSGGQWLHYDDSAVILVGTNKVLHDQAYVLFYKKVIGLSCPISRPSPNPSRLWTGRDHLDILPEEVHTIEDALHLFFASGTLEGYKASTGKAGVVSASKSLTLSKVLMLHLMRFSYGIRRSSKLHKPVRLSLELVLARDLLVTPPSGKYEDVERYRIKFVASQADRIEKTASAKKVAVQLKNTKISDEHYCYTVDELKFILLCVKKNYDGEEKLFNYLKDI